MPYYDYECESCKHTWEHEASIKEEPLKLCPQCQKETAKRLISGGGSFILNGGGWAREGYSNK